MKLFQHPDFEQAIILAAEHFAARGLRPALIERDYYATEALRILTTTFGSRLILKGGASLSKGWNLIQRFSEDMDLLLDPRAFDPVLGKKDIDRELKKLPKAVNAHKALNFVREESKTIRGFGSRDRFAYEQQFGAPGEIANRFVLKVGTASGREPTSEQTLCSYVGQFFQESGASLGAEDEQGFPMRLLHFRRTFVEKLFALHGKIEMFMQHGTSFTADVRHYYDLYLLAGKEEVLEMLRSKEYAAIKSDYDRMRREFSLRDYDIAPQDMSFANSAAIFPRGRLSATIGKEYQQQGEILCFGKVPSWAQVLARFKSLRELL